MTQVPAQPNQQPLISPQSPIPPKGMSEETDLLFRKWLKMQIASIYLSMFFKLAMFLLVAGSIVFSAVTLAPIVESQLSVLNQMLGTVNGLSGLSVPTLPTSSSSETNDGDSKGDSSRDFGIIEQLSDDQKKMIMDLLEK